MQCIVLVFSLLEGCKHNMDRSAVLFAIQCSFVITARVAKTTRGQRRRGGSIKFIDLHLYCRSIHSLLPQLGIWRRASSTVESLVNERLVCQFVCREETIVVYVLVLCAIARLSIARLSALLLLMRQYSSSGKPLNTNEESRWYYTLVAWLVVPSWTSPVISL